MSLAGPIAGDKPRGRRCRPRNYVQRAQRLAQIATHGGRPAPRADSPSRTSAFGRLRTFWLHMSSSRESRQGRAEGRMCRYANPTDQELITGELRGSSKLCRHASRSNYLIRWSGRRDSNSRPPAPHAGTLPGCATPRTRGSLYQRERLRRECSQRSSSIRFFNSCFSEEMLTPRASCARPAEGAAAPRTGAALRLSSRRLRAPLMVKPCS